MKEFAIDIQLRWADLDPNFHVRHSVYYDWGAQCRMAFFEKFNFTTALMQQLHVAPILFREECVFKKEIRSGDSISLDLKLVKSKRDYSRWTIQHTIKKEGKVTAAIITVDGTWIETNLRKLAVPPKEATLLFSEMSMSDDFSWID